MRVKPPFMTAMLLTYDDLAASKSANGPNVDGSNRFCWEKTPIG
jgi:hypothetical protein